MSELYEQTSLRETDIAVIGMSCRFPGAKDVDEFWQNLRNGVESISFFSDEELLASGIDSIVLKNPNYVKAKGILPDVELFDASFFGFSPREAEIIDPQHRLFLEEAWNALEYAGYNPDTYTGTIGVYAGASKNTYWFKNLYSNLNLSETASSYQANIGNNNDFLTTRVSYKLNLKGPSINVQTACSTSLVSIHLASQSLLNGECDMALAGGVSLSVPQKTGYLYQEGMILSPDGHCRAFDAQAKGIVGGSGVGIVLLKRLMDAITDGDYIHAIIKGTAINNDGSLKVGYTAPSVDGQAQVILEAQTVAGVEAETITYIEAHGTGTELGDPIEVSALTQAFRARTQKKGFCALGSVKTNFGHLDAAAGVAGFIKTVLALKHKCLPASLHFEHPNPKIDFANSPFYVNTTLSEWKTGSFPRRAGVNSFGIGGTNAHVILEEFETRNSAPCAKPQAEMRNSQSKLEQLLVISAKTGSALNTATANLTEYLRQHPNTNLADTAYTLQVGRRSFDHRRILVCQNLEEAVNMLSPLDPKRVLTNFQEPGTRTIVFMFPGQGAQYVNMGLGLYENEPVFRDQVDRCSEFLKPVMGIDLRNVLYPGKSSVRPVSGNSNNQPAEIADEPSIDLNQTAFTQPALFVIEYALAKLLMHRGIQPEVMIGHSVGEYVAACLAGVFSLDDALMLIAERGRLMQTLPKGAMLSVQLSEKEVLPLLGQELSLAAINAPSLCVISGPIEAVNALQNQLDKREIGCLRLHTSHAFHSHMMDPILEEFTERVRSIPLHSPKIPWISTVTGAQISTKEATDPGYWAKNLRQTVRFADGIEHLLKDAAHVLLEVGPGRTLTTLAKRHPDSPINQVLLSSLRHPHEQQTDTAFLLTTFGKLWLAGTQIDWNKFHAHEQRQRLPLPTYPFERQRYWIEPQETLHALQKSPGKKADIADWFYVPSWKRSPLSPFHSVEYFKTSEVSSWLIFVDDCGVGSQLREQLEQKKQHVVTVKPDLEFKKLHDSAFTLNPQHVDDYHSLFNELRILNKMPQKIVHLWSVTPRIYMPSDLEHAQDKGFYSLLFLAQAIGKQNITDSLHITVVSNHLLDVTGEEILCPEKATVLGPVRVIPQEYPNIVCRAIDLVLPQNGLIFSAKDSQESRISARLIEQLLIESLTESSNSIIAYRGTHRWVQTFEPIRLESSDGVTGLPLRERGVYLITGGLGGIGLVLATYLAETFRARLVLIGRSPFPNRDEWAQWLAAYGEQDNISRKIRKLLALEELGARVLVMCADVSDQQQMQDVLAQISAQWGPVHGVIHSAGVPAGGVIQRKNRGMVETILAPKMKGSLVLLNICKDLDIDFIVFCSSLASILGGFGQADYCAANAFLDALAQNLQRTGHLAISLDWDTWREVGMAVNTEVPPELQVQREKSLELGILPKEGTEIFARSLSSRLPQILISTRELLNRFERQKRFSLDMPLEDTRRKKSTHQRPDLNTNYIAPGNETEQALTEIWQHLLGIGQIGSHDDFFELGGDSLIATQMTFRIREKFGVSPPLAMIFEIPTIAQFAEWIVARRLEHVEQDEFERILSEVDNMTDEEVRQQVTDI